jgi:hypothetical protein
MAERERALQLLPVDRLAGERVVAVGEQLLELRERELVERRLAALREQHGGGFVSSDR